MNSFTHDPSEYIRGFQQLLISDKKRIGFLFGAGTSLAKKNEYSLTIPAITKMTKDITEKINDHNKKYKNALNEIKSELYIFNIETILSNLENKYQVIGNGKLNSLNKEDIQNLIRLLKSNVKEQASTVFVKIVVALTDPIRHPSSHKDKFFLYALKGLK